MVMLLWWPREPRSTTKLLDMTTYGCDYELLGEIVSGHLVTIPAPVITLPPQFPDISQVHKKVCPVDVLPYSLRRALRSGLSTSVALEFAIVLMQPNFSMSAGLKSNFRVEFNS